MEKTGENKTITPPAPEERATIRDAYQKEESFNGTAEDFLNDNASESKPRKLSSALDGLSDRLNNKFDNLDRRRKGMILLTSAIIIFILGMIYMYIFLSNLF